MHYTWHVRIEKAISANDRATLTMAYSHRSGVIGHGFSASAKRHRSWHAHIGYSLCASARRHRSLPAHIGCGLRA
ncbi:hypothetical protein H5410_015196 [Solanum commersonii]|uniref:Uncharacterized protein n=1 Tax=Solanum commersonii TaxID=4109 RepID=A0A9J5ZTP6_SOLCO|nr:hypothetical protein H5410_015196 [Solanum commersonii]